MVRSASIASAVFVLFTVACSSSSGPSLGSGAPSGLATTYAEGICGYYARCNAFVLKSSYGDAARCTSSLAVATEVSLKAKGTSVTQGQIDSCVNKMRTARCDEFVEASPECQFTGTLPDGSPCLSGSQCMSSSCFHAVVNGQSQPCGTCVQPVPEGADCSQADCDGANFCVDDRCVKPVPVGADCNTTDKICDVTLECIQGKCAAPLPSGATCELGNEDAPICDVFGGFTCVGSETSGTCQEIRFVPVGEPCGFDFASGALTSCLGASCSSLTQSGRCEAYVAEGAACREGGPSCEPGLQCTGGTCQKPDVTACQ